MEAFEIIPAWSILSGVASVLLYAYFTWTFNVFKKQGIKGPKPWPLFGNAYGLYSKNAAYTDVANAKIYGKVHGVFDGRTPVLMVGDPELVKEITVKEFSSFTNRPTAFPAPRQKPFDGGLNMLIDDHWRHVRTSLSPTFTSGKLKEMFATIEDCATSLAGYLEKQDGKPVDSKHVMSGYAMDVIAGTAFGLDVRSLESQESIFLVQINKLRTSPWPVFVVALVAEVMSQRLSNLCTKIGITMFNQQTLDYLENVIKSALQQRDRAEGRKDFTQLCVSQHVDITKVDTASIRTTNGKMWTSKGLTTDDIVSNAMIFLLAGFDTTSSLLNIFCYMMAFYPDIQQRLRTHILENALDGKIQYENLMDATYLDWCLDEALRMFPPSFRLRRICNKTTTIGGVHIPTGTTIFIPVYAIHHDPDYWPEPDVYRPERFSPEEKAKQHPCSFLPFGFGPRTCIGMRLSLLEMKVAIVKLLCNFEIFPSESTPKPPVKLGADFVLLKPDKPLMLIFKPRQVGETE